MHSQVRDDTWFFDTELLVLAERTGLRIHEVPVDWVDDPTSSADIMGTIAGDLRGIARIGSSLVRGELPLSVIGVVSTIAYAVLYLAFRSVVPDLLANFLTLLVPRSPTPPPTGGSPSGCGAPTTGSGTSCRAWACSSPGSR